MRWINHQTTTALMVYAGTGNISAAAIATAGSVFPDAIEFPFGNMVKHRGASHWPYPYIGLATICLIGWHLRKDLILYYLMMFLLGAIIHLVEDWMSPRGISWKMPHSKRQGLGLYVPFTGTEYLVAMVLIVVSLGYSLFSGYLDTAYLVGEVERIRLVCEYLGRRFFNM